MASITASSLEESSPRPHGAATTRPVPDSVRDAALDWLMGRINYERVAILPYQERQLKLDRMRQLLTRLGRPDAGLKIVHVAGTKGKGSTSAMVASMLSAAGYRTGVFSSPHLERIEERFVVDGLPCAAAELVALVDRVRPAAVAMDNELHERDTTGGPTYFEVTTAMALLHFAERRVDAVVLEVGLGGRLDSTNVCLPTLCIITSISFDHMKQLGNTLASIAREKAGIIKPGVPVVCGVTAPEAQHVIAAVAREHGCRLMQQGRDFSFTYRPPNNAGRLHSADGNSSGTALPNTLSTIDFSYAVCGQNMQLSNVVLAMRGPHQAANAATALAAVAELRHQGWQISEEAIRTGLSQTALPGRVELLPGEPTVVLDTAHNAASAQALVAALEELPFAARRTVLLSVSRDKDVRAIVRQLSRHFDRFVVTQYRENPRAVPAEALARIVTDMTSGRRTELTVLADPIAAWRHVQTTAIAGELVCVTGSFFLVAELRGLARGR